MSVCPSVNAAQSVCAPSAFPVGSCAPLCACVRVCTLRVRMCVCARGHGRMGAPALSSLCACMRVVRSPSPPPGPPCRRCLPAAPWRRGRCIAAAAQASWGPPLSASSCTRSVPAPPCASPVALPALRLRCAGSTRAVVASPGCREASTHPATCRHSLPHVCNLTHAHTRLVHRTLCGLRPARVALRACVGAHVHARPCVSRPSPPPCPPALQQGRRAAAAASVRPAGRVRRVHCVRAGQTPGRHRAAALAAGAAQGGRWAGVGGGGARGGWEVAHVLRGCGGHGCRVVGQGEGCERVSKPVDVYLLLFCA